MWVNENGEGEPIGSPSSFLEQSQILYKDVSNQQWRKVSQRELQQRIGSALECAVVGHLATQEVGLHPPRHEDTGQQTSNRHKDICRSIVKYVEEGDVLHLYACEINVECTPQSNQTERHREERCEVGCLPAREVELLGEVGCQHLVERDGRGQCRKHDQQEEDRRPERRQRHILENLGQRDEDE